MEFGLFDGGEDGEDNSVGHVEMCKIFTTQDAFFFEQNHSTEYSFSITIFCAELNIVVNNSQVTYLTLESLDLLC